MPQMVNTFENRLRPIDRGEEKNPFVRNFRQEVDRIHWMETCDDSIDQLFQWQNHPIECAQALLITGTQKDDSAATRQTAVILRGD